MSLSEIGHRISERVVIKREESFLRRDGSPTALNTELDGHLENNQWGIELPESICETNLEATKKKCRDAF